MKYFILNWNSSKWIESDFNSDLNQINLYDFIDGEMILKGIGQY